MTLEEKIASGRVTAEDIQAAGGYDEFLKAANPPKPKKTKASRERNIKKHAVEKAQETPNWLYGFLVVLMICGFSFGLTTCQALFRL